MQIVGTIPKFIKIWKQEELQQLEPEAYFTDRRTLVRKSERRAKVIVSFAASASMKNFNAIRTDWFIWYVDPNLVALKAKAEIDLDFVEVTLIAHLLLQLSDQCLRVVMG